MCVSCDVRAIDSCATESANVILNLCFEESNVDQVRGWCGPPFNSGSIDFRRIAQFLDLGGIHPIVRFLSTPSEDLQVRARGNGLCSLRAVPAGPRSRAHSPLRRLVPVGRYRVYVFSFVGGISHGVRRLCLPVCVRASLGADATTLQRLVRCLHCVSCCRAPLQRCALCACATVDRG